MGKIITPVPFSRVQKLEFPDLVNGVVSIVEGHNPATMHIEDQYNLLLEVQPQVSSLVVVNKKHPETKVLDGLRARRKNVLLAVMRQTKALAKANLESQTVQLRLVTPFVNTYWNDINTYNSKTITERLKQMLLAIEADSSLKAAFTALGLMIFIDELTTIQSNIKLSTEKRRKSRSTLPKMRTQEVKSVVGVALADMIEAIELARKAHPELDYMPMINEINVLLTSYQSDIKARVTRNKNATTTAASSTTTLATAV